MKNVICILFFSSYTLVASAQNSYLCIPSKSTGFSFDNNKNSWVVSTFITTESKRILIKSNSKWEWRRFGDKWGEPCGDISEAGWLTCNGFFGTVRFNKNNLRYVETYTFGYTDGKNNNENTPSISIGTCTPL